MAGGKHSGQPANESQRAIDEQERAQNLAEDFDVMDAIYTTSAQMKEERGEYPYDLGRYIPPTGPGGSTS